MVTEVKSPQINSPSWEVTITIPELFLLIGLKMEGKGSWRMQPTKVPTNPWGRVSGWHFLRAPHTAHRWSMRENSPGRLPEGKGLCGAVSPCLHTWRVQSNLKASPAVSSWLFLYFRDFPSHSSEWLTLCRTGLRRQTLQGYETPLQM